MEEHTARLAWREFVVKVQNHDCRDKCFQKCIGAERVCRYGYSRTIRPVPGYNKDLDRNEYVKFDDIDTRLSPYVPEWLFSWGANMNIQLCKTSGFISYIAKYITKPEPYGIVRNTEALSARCDSHIDRFLNARKVGAPEAVASTLRLPMKSPGSVVTCTTKLPQRRIRAIARKQPRRQ